MESSNINILIQALKRKPEKKKKMSRRTANMRVSMMITYKAKSLLVLKNKEPFQSDGSEVYHKSISKENRSSDENKEPEDSERVNEG